MRENGDDIPGGEGFVAGQQPDLAGEQSQQDTDAEILENDEAQALESAADQEILATLQDLAQDVLGVDKEIVRPSASFKDDLDADSLDLVEFVMAIEEKFAITLPEELLEHITNIGDAMDKIKQLLAQKASAGPDDSSDEDPGAGVREPRNPLPSDSAGQVELALPTQ